MPFKDPAKRAEAKRRWRLANPEKMTAAREAWAAAHPEKHAEYHKAWYDSDAGKAWHEATRETRYKRNAAWAKRNEDRMGKVRTAAHAVNNAIRAGKLTRPVACEDCGQAGGIQAAHSDYTQPLLVRWLCRACHTRWDHAEPKS